MFIPYDFFSMTRTFWKGIVVTEFDLVYSDLGSLTRLRLSLRIKKSFKNCH